MQRTDSHHLIISATSFLLIVNGQRSALGTHGKLEGHILQKRHIWVRLSESGQWWPILPQIVSDPYCARIPGDRKVVWNSLSFRLHELHKQLLGTFLKMSLSHDSIWKPFLHGVFLNSHTLNQAGAMKSKHIQSPPWPQAPRLGFTLHFTFSQSGRCMYVVPLYSS